MEQLAVHRTPRRARRLVIAALAAAPLAIAGPAQAGCFATAGLPSTPDGRAAGSTWTVDVTVRQHGDKLLAGATPTVILTPADGAPQRFDAVPTDQVGVYRADVTLPPAGTYALAVEDGFVPAECEQTHTFGSVSIAAAPPAAGGDPPAAQAAPVATQAAPVVATVEAAAVTVAAPPPAEPAVAASSSDDGNTVAWIVGGVAVGAAAVVGVAFVVRRTRGGAGPRPTPHAGS